jgi:outer membrane protein assembly factor BamE (lipoprotein component of BamABCDE complex)
MITLYRRLVLLTAALLALIVVVGCHEPERRKVTYIQEQQEGEVVEQSPGEMVVE